MSQLSAFQLQGPTITFTANTSGSVPAPVQTQPSGTTPGTALQNYIITNIGNVDAFVSCEASSDAATASAVIPTATGRRVHVVMQRTQMSITGPANAFFTGIVASSTAVIYVTPGEGL